MITGGKHQGLLLCLFTVHSKATKQHSSGSAVCSTLHRILTRVQYWRKKTQAALLLMYKGSQRNMAPEQLSFLCCTERLSPAGRLTAWEEHPAYLPHPASAPK